MVRNTKKQRDAVGNGHLCDHDALRETLGDLLGNVQRTCLPTRSIAFRPIWQGDGDRLSWLRYDIAGKKKSKKDKRERETSTPFTNSSYSARNRSNNRIR